ncbi:MAG: sel1 repeat family protein [Muribaculaceae bacterium]|nr:sel1 repeat family protein [Muribaculaceae bacterium]
MKKFILSLSAIIIALGAVAQTNAEQGKKWYDAERYDKALPFLIKAMDNGDVDSKARLASMIFTMQVPEYSMDRDMALKMLDDCIDAGSVFAMERKGFCTLLMGNDTMEDKMAAIKLLEEASEQGSGDASADLFKVYKEGVVSYASGENYIEPDNDSAVGYAKKACEQGNLTGKAYVGLYTFEGSNGYDKNESEGVKLMEQAMAMSERFFVTDCFEPAKALCEYYSKHGQATKASNLKALLKKNHPEKM